MPQPSAGILLYRRRENGLEVFLVHPGGPFWAKKEIAAWTIPKGEIAASEEPLAGAQRELQEETGFSVAGPFIALGTIRQAGGKVVHVFAGEADVDPAKIVSNRFNLEWPPRSGRSAEFPEVDRAAWFTLPDAAVKMNPAQTELLRRLVEEV